MTTAPVGSAGFWVPQGERVATDARPPELTRPSEEARRREIARPGGSDGGRGWHGPNGEGPAFPSGVRDAGGQNACSGPRSRPHP